MMRLNKDTFALIMSILPKDDCSRILRTCKTMRSLGMAYFVSEYTWSHTKRPHSLDKLLRCLLVDPVARMPLLQSLRLDCFIHKYGSHPGPPAVIILSTTSACLASVLSRACNLEELELSSSEGFIRNYAIRQAINDDCVALKRIKLVSAGETTVELISGMKHALTHLTLLSSEFQTTPRIHLSPHFAPTRVCLHMNGMTPYLQAESVRGRHLVFESVRELSVPCVGCDISALSRMFPNIAHVQLKGEGLSSPIKTAFWRSLDRVSMSSSAVEMSQIPFHVRHLDLIGRESLPEKLPSMGPSVLTLTLRPPLHRSYDLENLVPQVAKVRSFKLDVFTTGARAFWNILARGVSLTCRRHILKQVLQSQPQTVSTNGALTFLHVHMCRRFTLKMNHQPEEWVEICHARSQAIAAVISSL
jgi:hypothetical protein